MDRRRTEGAPKHEWLEHLKEEYKKDPAPFHPYAMLMSMGESAWEDTGRAGTGGDGGTSDLFPVRVRVGDIEVDFGEIITVKDPKVPEGFRKKAARWATIADLRSDTQIIADQHRQLGAELKRRKMALAELMRRAGKDDSVIAGTICDDVPSPKSEPPRPQPSAPA